MLDCEEVCTGQCPGCPSLLGPTESRGSEYFFVTVVIHWFCVSTQFQRVDLGLYYLLLSLGILNCCSGGPLSLMV